MEPESNSASPSTYYNSTGGNRTKGKKDQKGKKDHGAIDRQGTGTRSKSAARNGTGVTAVICLLLSMGFAALTVSAQAEPYAAESVRASRILVDKSERTLTLFSAGKFLRQYPIALGLNPRGHKQQEGDRRTPEGIYLIDFKNPDSAFYRSLRVSYPNERDRLSAEERGFEPGGQIMIHGTPNGRLIKTSNDYAYDWTDGCIAVSNATMDELWRLVELGTLIEIRP